MQAPVASRSDQVATAVSTLPSNQNSTSFRETLPRAEQQRTPFGISRYVLLVLHALYVFATARVLFGWPHLSNMLLKNGSYSWRCKHEASVEGMRYLCLQQDSAVQLLFTVGIGVSFSCSLFAGALLDWKGPKLTACVGQFLSTVGWILLAFAEEGRELYIPAVIFMALGADAGYLPAMNVSSLFPGYEQLVIVGMCSAMSASFSITTIMDAAWKTWPGLSFRSICLTYAGLGTGLCLFVALLCMPQRQYKTQEELTNDFYAKPCGISDPEDRHDLGDACLTETRSRVPQPSFRSQLKTKHFLLMYLYWPLNALFYNFYMTSAENLFGKDVNDLIGILGPVSMIPSILLGFLADRFGVMSLVMFIISSGVCMYVCALVPLTPFYYLSAIFSCLYVSNFSGQMYAYVGDTFRSVHFGRVVGIISITGGLVGLLRIPLSDHLTQKVFAGNYTYTCYIMLAVTVLCWCLAAFLFVIKRKQQKAFLAQDELEKQRQHSNDAKGCEVDV